MSLNMDRPGAHTIEIKKIVSETIVKIDPNYLPSKSELDSDAKCMMVDVAVTYGDGDPVYSTIKTAGEIVSAASSGKWLLCRIITEIQTEANAFSTNYEWYVAQLSQSPNGYTLMFSGISGFIYMYASEPTSPFVSEGTPAG